RSPQVGRVPGALTAAPFTPIEAGQVTMNVGKEKQHLTADDERAPEDDREQKTGDGSGREPRAPLGRQPRDDFSRPRREDRERGERGHEHHEAARHDLSEAPGSDEAMTPGSSHLLLFSLQRQTTPGRREALGCRHAMAVVASLWALPCPVLRRGTSASVTQPRLSCWTSWTSAPACCQ